MGTGCQAQQYCCNKEEQDKYNITRDIDLSTKLKRKMKRNPFQHETLEIF